MDENTLIQMLYLSFIQAGVNILFIQDNRTVNFDVPSMSDFTTMDGKMLAGETLLEMTNQFCKDNGFTPNGRIRSEYWTKAMGETAARRVAQEMGNT